MIVREGHSFWIRTFFARVVLVSVHAVGPNRVINFQCSIWRRFSKSRRVRQMIIYVAPIFLFEGFVRWKVLMISCSYRVELVSCTICFFLFQREIFIILKRKQLRISPLGKDVVANRPELRRRKILNDLQASTLVPRVYVYCCDRGLVIINGTCPWVSSSMVPLRTKPSLLSCSHTIAWASNKLAYSLAAHSW